MSDKSKQKLSAQVILQPADGKRRIPAEEITSENVAQTLPSGEDLKEAQTYFSDLGFDVGEGYANSFSITGEAKLFEKSFDTKISEDEKKAVKAEDENKTQTGELPSDKLPKHITRIVETVTFTEPPDYGPGNF